MRAVPEGLAGRLASETSTLAHCWRLQRTDGLTLGFTDHDCDLTFGGVTYVAATALQAAERSSELGFAIGGGEVSGVLDAAALTAADIANGRYDGAQVEIWLVDWAAPEHRLLLDMAVIGEVRRSGERFDAELRSITHQLDQSVGRIYAAACAADLGDAQCGVSLDHADLRGVGEVTATADGGGIYCSGLEGFADGWFSHGRLLWDTGANVGIACDVRWHRAQAGAVELLLWAQTMQAMAPGDRFTVTAGCDRSFAMCRNRFGNAVNFRGFPHMPGNDFALGAGQARAPMDGGSLFR